MPDYGYVCIKVFANGDVVMTKEKRGGLVITGLNEHIGMAIPVPPHGRLIDADELGLTDFEIVMCDGSYKKGLEMLAKKIEDAPTVISAEDGEPNATD